MTCILSGSLVDISQEPRAGVLFRFRRTDLEAQDGDIVDPSNIGVTTDGAGEFTVTLLPGNYIGEARLAGSRPSFTFGISEDDVTKDLSDALQEAPVYITPDVVLQAEAAAAAAAASAAAAEQSVEDAADVILAGLVVVVDSVEEIPDPASETTFYVVRQ